MSDLFLEAIVNFGTRNDLEFFTCMVDAIDPDCRRIALKAIAKLCTHDDLGLITGRFNDGSIRVVDAAIESFLTLVTGEDLDTIVDMSQNENDKIRIASIKALTKIGYHDLKMIINMIKDQEFSVQQAAMEAFLELVSHDDLDFIKGMLSDSDWHVRKTAVNAIAKVGTHQEMEIIIGLLNDDKFDYDFYDDVAKAIGKLCNHDDLEFICNLLENKHYPVRAEAMKTLVRIAIHEDAESLLDRIAKRAQIPDEIGQSHFEALCRLDHKFYCPVASDESADYDAFLLELLMKKSENN